jgi:hypothetical protein
MGPDYFDEASVTKKRSFYKLDSWIQAKRKAVYHGPGANVNRPAYPDQKTCGYPLALVTLGVGVGLFYFI